MPSHRDRGEPVVRPVPAAANPAVPKRGGSSDRRPPCLIAGVLFTAAAETAIMLRHNRRLVVHVGTSGLGELMALDAVSGAPRVAVDW